MMFLILPRCPYKTAGTTLRTFMFYLLLSYTKITLRFYIPKKSASLL